MTAVYVLLAVLAVLVVFLIRAEFKEDLSTIKIFKPLSTLCVISIALLSLSNDSFIMVYSMLIITGLLFSFGGDMALIFRHNNRMFRLGLVSFLIAHVIYTAVFSGYTGFSLYDIPAVIVMSIAALMIFLYLRDGLEGMLIPVIVYIIIISVMVVKAYTTFYSPVFSTGQSAVILAGALLFYISDVILAVARFKFPFRYNRISLAFYYAGQVLIALSTHMFKN